MRNIGEIGDYHVVITDHALERMVQMGVTPEEFKALILDPSATYKSKKYEDCFNHQKGAYSLGMRKSDRNELIVITVVYASLEDWCNAAKNGKLEGRFLTPDLNIPRRRQE